MYKLIGIAALLMFSMLTGFAEVKVTMVKGDVQVRRGVSEEWVPVSVGDALKPEDSMRSGKRSSAKMTIDGGKVLEIPESAIIDVSDLRNLTQEELLLMLAMERVRSVPQRERNNDFDFLMTTTMHGANKSSATISQPINLETGMMQLNGTAMLFKNGFYATCVLKTKEVFRLVPELSKRNDIRFMVADALERMKLPSEALSEYVSIPQEQLSPVQRLEIERKISQLKKQQEG